MRTTSLLLVISMLLLGIIGCSSRPTKQEYYKFSGSFYDTFDTITQVVGYTQTQEQFDYYLDAMHKQFLQLHKLFDIYNSYEGIANMKTINDNAGIHPVVVDQPIIDLLLFAKHWNDRAGAYTNIAMGPVLRIWEDYRDMGLMDAAKATLPPIDALRKAKQYTDMDQVIIDKDNQTVYLAEPGMSLNVGAIAKGYATELVATSIMEQGLSSGIISSGGNVRVLGQPLDGRRARWGIGIHDPDRFIALEESNLLDTIFLNNASVVSSGDYQRYYVVDGQVIHHIIDPETLMPALYYRAVTIVAEDSGVADYLSTTAFVLPYKESRALIDRLEGVEAIWVLQDGRIEATDGMKSIMKSHGASGAMAF